MNPSSLEIHISAVQRQKNKEFIQMKNFAYRIPLFLAAILLVSSCTEIVEIELGSTYKRLVVHGIITSDSLNHGVELTTTTDYFFNENPPPVQQATVSVAFNDTIIYLEEIANRPGIYKSSRPFRGEPGVTYFLEISDVDIDEDGDTENYAAETTMPEIAKADSITLTRFVTPFFSGYQVALWSPDPPGVNYYNYKLFLNGAPINRRLSDYTVQPDDFFNNNYAAGLPVGFLNDDDEDETINPGAIITLEINSITEDYYNFIVDAQSEIFGNNPLFSGPPANVPTNITNNAVGIFAAYSIDRISAVLASPEL